MSIFSIATINTRGLNDPVKCQSVFNFLHHEDHDIVLLQECCISFRENYKLFQDRWQYGTSIWSGDNKNRCSGVAILFKGHNPRIQRIQQVIDGRLLCIDLVWKNIQLRIINIYCPSELQERLETLKSFLRLGNLPMSLREGTISLLFKKGNKKDLKKLASLNYVRG
uniref:Endonuclease/exonuclease/phosphatase domain-containing protein n=1 Tax=Esox lucius TaxID=8010 RepID=A0AAY5JZ32_ESOLU